MPPSREVKFLRSVLSRLDRAPSTATSARWRLFVAWLLLVLLFTVAFAVAPLISQAAFAAVFLVLGVLGTIAYFLIVSAYGWSVLGRYVDRNAIEARLRELGA